MAEYGKNRSAKRRKKAAGPSALGPMILSWLIPGYAFMRNGHVARGVFFFVALQVTFLIGVWLRGSVLVPEFNFREPGFNLINVLIFITQMFNGGLGFLSMLPDVLGPTAAIFPYDEAATYADLGVFYLLVSGGMNYFVMVRGYDCFYSGQVSETTDSKGNA